MRTFSTYNYEYLVKSVFFSFIDVLTITKNQGTDAKLMRKNIIIYFPLLWPKVREICLETRFTAK